MQLSKTTDAAIIKEFMTQDEVWVNFCDDMADKVQYEPSIDTRHLWVRVTIDDVFVGIVLLENYNLSTLKLHPYLLKKYKKHSRELVLRALRLFMKTPYFVNKIIVEIPTHRKIVYNLAKKIGFIDEGINKESFLKSGVFLDQWNLGLTKAEVKKVI